MVNTSWSESCLANHEAVAFVGNEVAHRNTHVVENGFGVTFLVDVTKHGEVALQRDAWCIDRNQDLTLLLMRRCFGVGLPHHNENFCIGVKRI